MDENAAGLPSAEVASEVSKRLTLSRFLHEPVDVRSFTLFGLFLLTLGYTLYFARAFLLPIVVALFFYFLLLPLIKALKQLHIPEAAGAAVTILACLGLIGYGAYRLTEPATEWLAKVPQSVQHIERKLRPLQQSVQGVSEATKQVEKMTQMAEEKTLQQTVQVNMGRRNLADLMLNTTSSFVAGLFAMLILLYFLLASGELFLLKLVKILPSLHDKKVAVTIVHQLEHDISVYLLTVTIINTALGAATSLAMILLGMPNPVLWGVVAGLLNFVPYVSAVITTTLLGLVAFLTIDSLGRAFLVPVVYVVLNCLEGFVITPLVHSRHFTLNPVAIIIWLAFWGWLWGIAGTLLAVPMLVTLKILCDHFTSLAPLSEFLAQ